MIDRRASVHNKALSLVHRRVEGPRAINVSYTYDSMGRMLTRDDGTDLTQFTWDGWDCIKEVTGESETVYHIPQGQILSFIRDGVTYQAHSDALGSVRMITDEAGEVVARYEYSGFGEAISVTEDPALTDFPARFVGSRGVRFDATTGLHYMRKRWYDKQTGRFVSRDPLRLAGGFNLYTYVSNNPIKFTDIMGQQIGGDGTPGYADATLLNGPEAAVFADALGLLARLGGDYAQAAKELQSIHAADRLFKSDAANKMSSWEGGGWGDALTEDWKIYLNPSWLNEAGQKCTPAKRFRLALQLAGVLYHELSHWRNKEFGHGGKAREKVAYEKQLKFLRDYYNFEADTSDPAIKAMNYTERHSDRLKDALDIGNGVQDTSTRSFNASQIFPGGASIRWRNY